MFVFIMTLLKCPVLALVVMVIKNKNLIKKSVQSCFTDVSNVEKLYHYVTQKTTSIQ